MVDVPSVGDVLMLSQLAWRIGRAFVGGGDIAPPDFREVERLINALSRSLKLLADALFNPNNDDNLLLQASEEAKMGLGKLLSSCRQTLQDLDSLVAEHQTTVKTNTSSGFAVERVWTPMVLANYKYMMWTSEGGTLQSLKELLGMHTNTFKLTTTAVQSRSVQNLEAAVLPVAEKVGHIHRESGGNFEDRISDVNRALNHVANGEGDSHMDISPGSEVHELESASSMSAAELEDFPPPPPLKSPRRGLSPPEAPRSELQGSSVGDLSAPSRPPSHRSGSSSGQVDPRWSSLSGMSTAPLTPAALSLGRQASLRSQFSNRSAGMNTAMSMSPIGSEPLPPHLMAVDRHSSIVSMDPLPPAMVMEIDSESNLNRHMGELSIQPRIPAKSIRIQNAMASTAQTQEFETDAFRNSAILCEVRGLAVEFTRPVQIDPEEIDPQNPYGVELVQAMEACRIYIVKKRETLPKGETHISTSIWAFSDDGNVRLQQKLLDDTQYIPYSSYFSPEKISLTVPTEVKYHDVIYGSRPLQVQNTSWINYVVEDAPSAASFQNELMSRTLIAQFKTEKTLRLHEGLVGVLSYQEQMCGMENLRIWEDEVTKGIFAMIHFSAQFRPGYFAFWLNSSQNPVRVKDDGGREVKVKGLRIPHGEDPKGKGKAIADMPRRDSSTSRRGSENKRVIGGARIEFSSEVEKYAFLDVVKQVQQTMILLPDLM